MITLELSTAVQSFRSMQTLLFMVVILLGYIALTGVYKVAFTNFNQNLTDKSL